MFGRAALNYVVLAVFAPVLVLTGILGFFLPPSLSLFSGASSYNVFHIVFGLIGLLLVVARNIRAIRIFNVGFGLIDLYQAYASHANLFPMEHFRWTHADDLIHIVIGVTLVVVGLICRDAPKD
jgi:hypothetical protein